MSGASTNHDGKGIIPLDTLEMRTESTVTNARVSDPHFTQSAHRGESNLRVFRITHTHTDARAVDPHTSHTTEMQGTKILRDIAKIDDVSAAAAPPTERDLLCAHDPGREPKADSIELHQGHLLLRVHRPDVLVNVRGLLAAEGAVGALVPGRFAALVPIVADHGVVSAVAVVAIWTVILAGARVELRVPLLRVLLQAHRAKIEHPATYKRSCHGQHRSLDTSRSRGHRRTARERKCARIPCRGRTLAGGDK